MSCINSNILAGASGSAGGDKVYVDDVFSTYVYPGTGSSQPIPNGIDLDGEGGLTWVKCRTASENHILVDTERGVSGYALSSNNTNGPYAASNLVTAFNSNGFTVGANGTTGSNGEDYTSWTFRKAPGFFDVVTYNGQSNNGVDDTWIAVPHNLKSTPGMIFIKTYSATYPGTNNATGEGWIVWHRSLPTSSGTLHNTAPFGSNYQYYFGHSSGAADADNIYVRAGQSPVSYPGMSYVAYVFAHDDPSFGTDGDESIIKCGTYTGSSANNYTQEINLGFEPQWLLVKGGSSQNWHIIDTMRGFTGTGTSGDAQALSPDDPDQEPHSGGKIRVTSTGFKLDAEGSSQWNSGGTTYVYMAIRRPNKPPEVGTDVFAMDVGSASSTTPTWDSGFPVDFAIRSNEPSTRLQGTKDLKTYNEDGEGNNGNLSWDSNLGWGKAYGSTSLSYMFRRAPSFMDVVAYSGTSAAHTIYHNLSVVPELIFLKGRQSGYKFRVEYVPSSIRFDLSSTAGADTTNLFFTGVTNSYVYTPYVGSIGNSNGNKYILYLFASLSGISKIGTYNGNTGYAVEVPCGFTNGARFVMIKRTNGTGDWYYWDTYRGISISNDKYRRFNIDAGDVTGTNYINPLITGFTVNASVPAALNVTGGTYLYLAIA